MSTTWYNEPLNDFKVFLFLQGPAGLLLPPVRLVTHNSLPPWDAGMASGDINGDGADDLALATTAGVDLYLQLGVLAPPILIPSSQHLRQVEIADVDADGDADVVAAGRYDTLLYRQSALLWSETKVGPYLEEVEVGDLTGDGRLDIAGFTRDDVKVLAQTSNGSFAAPSSYRAQNPSEFRSSGGGLDLADVTGDGRTDALLSLTWGEPNLINVFPQNAEGTFACPPAFPAFWSAQSLEVADMTNDGLPDVVVAHGGWFHVGVLVGQPDGSFSKEALYRVTYASHYAPKGLAVGDVSGDGLQDIVVADYNHGLIVLRETAPSGGQGMSGSAVPADLEGARKPECPRSGRQDGDD